MRHLTAADYRAHPWANGRGVTLELARVDGTGGMVWRMSIAQVTEDGPFSLFPGVDRILTVLDGPGFDLKGPDWSLHAGVLQPVAFPGDVAVAARQVTMPCRDFNVMTRRGLAAVVRLAEGDIQVTGETVAILALETGTVRVGDQPVAMARHDLLLGSGPVDGHIAMPVLLVAIS